MNTLSPALLRLADDLRHDGHECHSSRADRCANDAAALETALTEARAELALARADAIGMSETTVAMLRADNRTLRNRVDEMTALLRLAKWLDEIAKTDLIASRMMVASERARADTAEADLGTMREMLSWVRLRRDALQRTLDALAADAATDADTFESAAAWDVSVCQGRRAAP